MSKRRLVSALSLGGILLASAVTAPRALAAAQPDASASPASQPGDAPGMASREHRDRLIAQARQRMLQDRGKYSDEQLKECEDLYQVANKNWRSDSAKASLKVMIERYPDLNRTGCGALYLAQYERDREARIRRLQEVIEKYSDCCFGNGAQVGALARFYLGIEHLEAGKRDEAKKLFDEIQEQYPGAITHRGELISHRVKQILAQTGSTRAPAGGGN